MTEQGTHPTGRHAQADFLGILALVLIAVALLSAAVVIFAAMTSPPPFDAQETPPAAPFAAEPVPSQ